MPDPIYRQHPELYAYSLETKKHMLRSGRAYKKTFEVKPKQFVDSSSMFQTPQILHAPAVTTPPLPVPNVEVPIEVKKHEVAREQVKTIISAELTENPKVYAGKSKPELDSMFRALLIARLTDTAPPPKAKLTTINKSTKLANVATKPKLKQKKPKFKLREIVSSEDEGDENQSSESDA